MSMGQWLSVPMILAGVGLFVWASKARIDDSEPEPADDEEQDTDAAADEPVGDDLGMGEQVLWSSFNHNTLLPLVDEVGRDAVALLFADALVKPWDYADALGVGALHPGLHLLQDPAYVEAAHTLDLKVNTWTVDSPEHCRLAAAAGVDAIITNHPDDARAAVEGGR